MKITVDIECTPEEARRFFGWPDVSGVNDAMIDAIQTRLNDAVANLDGETLLRQWMTGGSQAWQSMQDAFWHQMRQAAGGSGPSGSSGA